MWWEVVDRLTAIDNVRVVAMIVFSVVNHPHIGTQLAVHLLRLQLFHLLHRCGEHRIGRSGCVLDGSRQLVGVYQPRRDAVPSHNILNQLKEPSLGHHSQRIAILTIP
jgi:hypothetical protein